MRKHPDHPGGRFAAELSIGEVNLHLLALAAEGLPWAGTATLSSGTATAAAPIVTASAGMRNLARIIESPQRRGPQNGPYGPIQAHAMELVKA
jgi:hypothetical protein